ncbi:MAG: Gfo/Idh/MocA family protein [bacterium]
MVKVGIVGAGVMGRTHGEAYKNIPSAKVVAVADVRREEAGKLAEPFGAKVYPSGEKLIESADVDVVDICLPTFLHREHAVKAAKAGRHVLCEKPMALTVRDADAMIRAAERGGVKLMVAQCIRFWPEYQVLKEYVKSRSLGRLVALLCTRVGYFPKWTWKNWMAKEELSGSTALDLHIHDTDFIYYLLGKPKSVYSKGLRDKRGIYHICTLYGYDGCTVCAEGSWTLPEPFGFEMAFRASFQKGAIVYSSKAKPTITIYENDKEPYSPELPMPNVPEADTGGNISIIAAYFSEIEYFIDCVSKGKYPDVVTPLDARTSVEIARAEMKSVDTGRIIKL